MIRHCTAERVKRSVATRATSESLRTDARARHARPALRARSVSAVQALFLAATTDHPRSAISPRGQTPTVTLSPAVVAILMLAGFAICAWLGAVLGVGR
jgi:hypothetical protein